MTASTCSEVGGSSSTGSACGSSTPHPQLRSGVTDKLTPLQPEISVLTSIEKVIERDLSPARGARRPRPDPEDRLHDATPSQRAAHVGVARGLIAPPTLTFQRWLAAAALRHRVPPRQ